MHEKNKKQKTNGMISTETPNAGNIGSSATQTEKEN